MLHRGQTNLETALLVSVADEVVSETNIMQIEGPKSLLNIRPLLRETLRFHISPVCTICRLVAKFNFESAELNSESCRAKLKLYAMEDQS
jgi:hypothetical protein